MPPVIPSLLSTASPKPSSISLARLRAYAVSRSLFKPTSLPRAMRRLGFVQADPIRAPARAQDLILRLRVDDYRDGDLERRYPRLDVEEDVLHNYGFLHRELQALLHPRTFTRPSRIERSHPELFDPILEFVRANGPTHPRDLDPHHGGRSVTNYWGGSSSAATHVLDLLHYRGALRVMRRDNGVRVYAPATHHRAADVPGLDESERVGRLLAHVVDLYAPLPESSLRQLATMLRYGAPHLEGRLRDRAVIRQAVDHGRIVSVTVDGTNWIVPAAERIDGQPIASVRLLTPFDPVVWDRRRFELLWSWRYRFEAYTPPAQRRLGYYALPVLFEDNVIGWANVKNSETSLTAELGFPGRQGQNVRFRRELEAEIERIRVFLGISRIASITTQR